MGRKNPTVVFVGPGRVEIEDRPILEPQEGEVLVATSRSLISPGTEMTLLQGGVPEGSAWDKLRVFPKVPGYSNVGEVIAVGPGVDKGWIGRKVHNHGAHQKFAISPAKKLAEVPDSVPDEEATFATLAKVAMNGVRRGGVTWGESVVVLGLGILGQISARICLFAGARPVFVVEPHGKRQALLPEHPAICAVFPGDLRDIVKRNYGKKVDVAIDTTGDPEAIPAAARLLRTAGRLVITASPRGLSLFDFHDLCNRESLTIIGAHSSHHALDETPHEPFTSAKHGEIFLRMMSSGEIDVAPLISHSFSANKADEAYELIARDRASTMGVILRW